jgi:hypothetical protein
VDHAGLKLPLHPWLIDLTSSSVTRTQLQLLSTLRPSSTAMLVAPAKEVSQVKSMNLLTHMVSQTPHASNMLLQTQANSHAIQSNSARTAHGHHAQSAKLAKTNAGLLTTESSMPLTTIHSRVRTK